MAEPAHSTNPSRRLFLAAGSASAVFAALSTAAVAGRTTVVPDPLLALIRDYESRMAAFEAAGPVGDDDMDALLDRTYRPALLHLDKNPPAPTTIEGALAGLDYVQGDLDAFRDYPPVSRVMRLCLDFLRAHHAGPGLTI